SSSAAATRYPADPFGSGFLRLGDRRIAGPPLAVGTLPRLGYVLATRRTTRRTRSARATNTKPSRSFCYEIIETHIVGARALRARRCAELDRERAGRAGYPNEGGARVAGSPAGGQGSRRGAQADRDGAVRRRQDRPDGARSDRGRRLVHRGAVGG